MRLSLGFPEREAELALLAGEARRPEAIGPCLTAADLLALQEQTTRQHCSPALLNYVLDLLAASRAGHGDGLPLSPRAGLGLVAAARAWSLLEGRDHVTPDDVQVVLEPVCEHRLDGGRDGRQGLRSSQLRAAVNPLR
jgi:MoxR-like ATPase